ncbi:hypothetical protein U8326_00035 [Tsuneonella sp. CC-YZS046]|uniref:hypothetical protein n=1 Tax=Tsuneonella sp. CC-YZS046 TaxID=3042152 RepID=UPI002D79F73D|nr:hypothetical protein [Tsuneonella sp. CC-YZS046]WRO66593.1 hypothetical protein U8326_00035 [Tsuneonella sp. CC-YZS046]
MLNEIARSTYLDILAEIKLRQNVVLRALNGEVALPAKIIEEICTLQFRMIAELLAIGCLILHEDLVATKAGTLTTSTKAGQIFRKLALLHDDFFPQPLKLERDCESKFVWRNLEGPFMTRQMLINAYEKKIAPALHRGDSRRIFKADRPVDFARIAGWHEGIYRLLDRHTVISPDRQHICHFSMGTDDEPPACTLFEKLQEEQWPPLDLLAVQD